MAANRIGQRIGPYEIMEEIGRGGVSRVYRACDHSRDREVAIKIMTAEAIEDEDFVRRFQREIDIASALDHPNILPVLDWGRDEELFFLVMPLITHGSLNDVLRQGKTLTPYQVWRIAFQIADALDFAHSQGIVHRDVKPHNIMVVDEGSYALTDFGLVKLMDERGHITQTGSVMGSPSYMSPEQARCRPLDQRCDVYSLGIVLYECLVGRLPYSSNTAMEMIGQHVLARPLLPTQIAGDFPREIEAVLMRALVKDPNVRYPSAGDLARAFGTALMTLSDEIQNRALVTREQIMDSAIIVNDPVTLVLPPEPAPKPKWGRIGLLAGGMAALVVLLAVIINLAINRPTTADMRFGMDTYQAGATLVEMHGSAGLHQDSTVARNVRTFGEPARPQSNSLQQAKSASQQHANLTSRAGQQGTDSVKPSR